ncbi:MAG: hypothetical protein IPP43_05345, partial [Chitinophagaceae bacterium]|nr:hypothetical protein [Chitinophagaceae bacterium]
GYRNFGKELERISGLTTPNKVLAIVQQFDRYTPGATKGKITLVLDAVQDPGNLGTIIRIADWFGVEQIVCSADTADVYNSKWCRQQWVVLPGVKVFIWIFQFGWQNSMIFKNMLPYWMERI